MQGMIAAHLAQHRGGYRRVGTNYTWWRSFRAGNRPLAQRPCRRSGFGAVLNNLSGPPDRRGPPRPSSVSRQPDGPLVLSQRWRRRSSARARRTRRTGSSARADAFLAAASSRNRCRIAYGFRLRSQLIFEDAYGLLTRNVTVDDGLSSASPATLSSARSCSSAIWSSTTPASESSSRTAGARSEASSPGRASWAATRRQYLGYTRSML